MFYVNVHGGILIVDVNKVCVNRNKKYLHRFGNV